jgi:hypothetical protein
MSFDYGTEEKVGGLGENIKLWSTTGNKTALLDADAIAYVVGYTSDMQQYLRMKRSKDWKDSDVFTTKKQHASFLINKWINQAACDSAILYITNSADNFRLEIAKSKVYKGERIEEKPPFFHEVREWIIDFHGAVISNKCEADDEISIEAWKRHLAFDGELWTPEHKAFSDFVVISNDKDLGIIPGWRCHPKTAVLEWVEPLGNLTPVWKDKEVNKYEYWPIFKGKPVDLIACNVRMMYGGEIKVRIKGELKSPKNKWELDHVWYKRSLKQDTYTRGVDKGKGKFKRVKVGKTKSEYIATLKGTGLKFFYSQLITGDTVDNFSGVPMKGDTFAYNLLDNLSCETALHEAVYLVYLDYYKTKDIAEVKMLETGQLAWMQCYKGELWQLKSNGQSFPK